MHSYHAGIELPGDSGGVVADAFGIGRPVQQCQYLVHGVPPSVSHQLVHRAGLVMYPKLIDERFRCVVHADNFDL